MLISIAEPMTIKTVLKPLIANLVGGCGALAFARYCLSRGKYSLPISLLKLTATHIQEATNRLNSAVLITPAISNERTEISIAT